MNAHSHPSSLRRRFVGHLVKRSASLGEAIRPVAVKHRFADYCFGKIALFSIAIYKRLISPFKGYRCAHAVAGHGGSCSSVIEQSLRQSGFAASMSLAPVQAGRCQDAARMIHLSLIDQAIHHLPHIADVGDNLMRADCCGGGGSPPPPPPSDPIP